MDTSSFECPLYLLDNIKSEVDIKEEEVDEYFETSSEEFIQNTQEETTSSLCSISNSSCDADSSRSMEEEDPLMIVTKEEKHERIKKQNKEASFHYRSKKKYEKQHLTQTLLKEEKMNSQLIEKFSNSNSSACDIDSLPSRMEDPLIAKTQMNSGNSSSFSLFTKLYIFPQRSKRCRILSLSPEMKNFRKREQNNAASSRYRTKKKLERERLTQLLSEEEERNAHLKREFKTLLREASYLKDLLRADIQLFYSSSD